MKLTKELVILFIKALSPQNNESWHEMEELEQMIAHCPAELPTHQLTAMKTPIKLFCFGCGALVGEATEPFYHNDCFSCPSRQREGFKYFDGFLRARAVLSYSDPVIDLVYAQFLLMIHAQRLDLPALRKQFKVRPDKPVHTKQLGEQPEEIKKDSLLSKLL